MAPDAKRVAKVYEACSAARLSRYRPVVGNDRDLLVQLHTWNAVVSSALLPTLHLAEVTIRNFALKRLQTYYRQPHWYENPKLQRKLGYQSHLAKTLEKTLNSERALGRSGDLSNFITSELPFGFWVNVFTTKFRQELWIRPLHTYSIGFPRGASLKDIHQGVDEIRVFRNNVAHHKNVICKAPDVQFDRITEVLSWFCKDTALYARETALFPSVWAAAPIDVRRLGPV